MGGCHNRRVITFHAENENAGFIAPGQYLELWFTWGRKDEILTPGRHRMPVNVMLILDDEYLTANNLHFRDMQATFYVEFYVE